MDFIMEKGEWYGFAYAQKDEDGEYDIVYGVYHGTKRVAGVTFLIVRIATMDRPVLVNPSFLRFINRQDRAEADLEEAAMRTQASSLASTIKDGLN